MLVLVILKEEHVLKAQENKHWHSIVKKYGYTIAITHENIFWEEACCIRKLSNIIFIDNMTLTTYVI